MKYIGLIDCNNFFVSCERLFRPDLNNKPVVVCSGDNGCVIARSKEVKDMGVGMGTPLFQIKDILSEKNTTIFSSNHKLYQDISRRVLYVVKRNFSEAEQYSIDECFFHIDSKDLMKKISDLKRQVEREVGIPVSIGVAPTKTIAKYATTLAKRTNGLSFLTLEDWKKESGQVKLSALWGVGPARTGNFSKDGLKTVGEFLSLSQDVIRRKYGLEGQRLSAELSGQAVYSLSTSTSIPKSMMSTASFGREVLDKNSILEAVFSHLRTLTSDLITQNLKVSQVRLLLYPSRYGNYAFYGASVEEIFDCPTDDILLLNKVISDMFNKSFISRVPYKKAGIVFSSLSPSSGSTASLFSLVSPAETNISSLIVDINNRLGQDVLRMGAFIKNNVVSKTAPKSSLRSLSYTTDWLKLKSVKA